MHAIYVCAINKKLQLERSREIFLFIAFSNRAYTRTRSAAHVYLRPGLLLCDFVVVIVDDDRLITDGASLLHLPLHLFLA